MFKIHNFTQFCGKIKKHDIEDKTCICKKNLKNFISTESKLCENIIQNKIYQMNQSTNMCVCIRYMNRKSYLKFLQAWGLMIS